MSNTPAVSEINEVTPPVSLRENVEKSIRQVPMYQRSGYQLLTGEKMERHDWLERLPFITKADLRCKFPHNFLGEGIDLEAMVEDNLLEVDYTSGTSEERTALLLPFGWWNRQEAVAFGKNNFVRELLAQHPNARRVTINSPVCSSDICYTTMPMQRDRIVGNALFLSLSRHPFLWSEAELERMAREAVEWQPLFLDVDPVYGAVFAQFCERRGIKLPSVKFILCSYEFVSVIHCRILQRVFNVPIFNLYGATETGHLLMENEKGEMIPAVETAFLEVINADEQEIGELVGTTLTNNYMPLIRYRIGDLAQRIKNNGSIKYILHGRKKDAFVQKNGFRVTTLQIDKLFSQVKGLTHYQVLELTGGGWELRYVPEGKGPDASVMAEVQKRLAKELMIEGQLELKATDLLMPEGSGKFRLGYPLRAPVE